MTVCVSICFSFGNTFLLSSVKHRKMSYCLSGSQKGVSCVLKQSPHDHEAWPILGLLIMLDTNATECCNVLYNVIDIIHKITIHSCHYIALLAKQIYNIQIVIQMTSEVQIADM